MSSGLLDSIVNNGKDKRTPAHYNLVDGKPVYGILTGQDYENFMSMSIPNILAPVTGTTTQLLKKFTSNDMTDKGWVKFRLEYAATNAHATDSITFKTPFSNIEKLLIKFGGVEFEYNKEQIDSAFGEYVRLNQHRHAECIAELLPENALGDFNMTWAGLTSYNVSLPLECICPQLGKMHTDFFKREELCIYVQWLIDQGSTDLNTEFFKCGSTANVYPSISYNNIGVRSVISNIDPFFQKYDPARDRVTVRNYEVKRYSNVNMSSGNTYTVKLKDFNLIKNAVGAFLYVNNKASRTAYNDVDACVHLSNPRDKIAVRLRDGTKTVYDHHGSAKLIDRLRKAIKTQKDVFGCDFNVNALQTDSFISKYSTHLTYIDFQGIDFQQDEFPINRLTTSDSEIEIDIQALASLGTACDVVVVLVYNSLLKIPDLEKGTGFSLIKGF